MIFTQVSVTVSGSPVLQRCGVHDEIIMQQVARDTSFTWQSQIHGHQLAAVQKPVIWQFSCVHGMWLWEEQMAVTGSRVALPCYHVSPAGTLATRSSPTDAADPVHNTTSCRQQVLNIIMCISSVVTMWLLRSTCVSK